MDRTERYLNLTAAEISQLWTAYVNDTMGLCIMQHLRATVDDPDIASVIEYALHLCTEHLSSIADIFRAQGVPVPIGFTDQDVDPKAPRLFSDGLMLQYLKNMGTLGMTFYALAISVSAREDVIHYFTECLASATELHNRSLRLLLEKGIYVRAPYIPLPDAVEFVQKPSFLNGFLGDGRPLNSLEINQIFFNHITNALGQALMMGYSQTARDPEVVAYIRKGRDIATDHISVFSKLLEDDDLSVPNTWVTYVTESTVPPVSDKLMLMNTTFLIAAGIGNYGLSASVCSRRDLGATYAKLMAECAAFAEEGAKMMIEREWLEKIPGAVDRDALVSST
ncbi:DUF3231 family protein [Paenibacillus sp. TRM 82003]|nr:DUF3231 family protein [Paenibacillus sp. TRM 82003]